MLTSYFIFRAEITVDRQRPAKAIDDPVFSQAQCHVFFFFLDIISTPVLLGSRYKFHERWRGDLLRLGEAAESRPKINRSLEKHDAVIGPKHVLRSSRESASKRAPFICN